MPPVTNAVVLPTIYGNVIVNRHDINQTLYLLQTGAAIDQREIDIISQLVEPGTIAIDIGACFGIWTLAFAQRAAQVYSFEAQRLIYNCLCGTLALNSIENVEARNYAIGGKWGTIQVPRYNYHESLQFGCVYLRDRTTQGDMKQEPNGSETVSLLTLDGINLSNVSMIKIDVEGMELEVLEGAKDTIERNRPAMYIETILVPRADVEKILTPFGYIFTGNSDNLLALPAEKYTLETQEDGKTLIRKKEPS